ncbi:SCP2 sterol-binding domain-containing protein, partial [Candidatus Hakubella thermalkaliphila]
HAPRRTTSHENCVIFKGGRAKMTYAYGTAEWEKAYLEMVEKRLATVARPYILGSPEWVATYEKMIQESQEYKEAAKGWEGTVVIHIMANPALGLPEDSYLLLDLWHGECRSVRLVPREVGVKADYILSGELERWEAVTSGALNVTKAMMQGKIKLKGSLAKIVRYVKASTLLTEIATHIETRHLSQLSDEEREQYRKELNELKAEFGF